MPYVPAVVLLMLIYMASLVGVTMEHQRDWFLFYTPHIIVFNALLLALYHRPYRWPMGAFLVGSLVVGAVVEGASVYTGMPYGDYAYGNRLGPMVAGVPLILPLYWWILAYSSGRLAGGLGAQNDFLKILLGATLMAGLAVLIQSVAAPLGFWYAEATWRYGLSWWLAGVVLQMLWRRWSVADSNAIAGYVYGGLLIFFAGIVLFLKV